MPFLSDLSQNLHTLHDQIAMRWQSFRHILFFKKICHLYELGIERHLIATYSDDFINRMRGFSHHSIPASIILLSGYATCHHCQGVAVLMTNILAVDDDPISLKKVSLESLRIDPENPNRRDRLTNSWHYIIELVKPDGTHWIADPTMGLIYRKWLFRLMEFPRILETVDLADLPELTLNREYCPLEDCPSRRLAVPLLIFNIQEATKNHPVFPYEHPHIATTQPSDSNLTTPQPPDQSKPKSRLEEELDLFISTPEFQAASDELHALIDKQLEIDPDYLNDDTRPYDPNNLLDKVTVEVHNFWSIRKPPT